MTASHAKPKRRTEPADTRERLLEAAGHVFAEKGFDRATAKEIAQRAGTNAASVNYHFGGVDALYVSVLEEARRRMLSLDELTAALIGKTDPKEKLQATLELLVRGLTGPLSTSWMLRVFAHEYVAPSSLLARLDRRDSEKRLRGLKGLVAELMGLPDEHPAVAFGCLHIVAPCMMLMIADRKMLEKIFPDFASEVRDPNAFAHRMTRYALGGLTALADNGAEP